MILIGGAALLFGATLLSGPQQTTPPTDPAPLVRRLAATAQLAAQEYRVGIVDGRVASQAEVDEARLFLLESRRSAQALPAELSRGVLAEIDSVIGLVDHTAAPDSVDVRVRRLASTLSSRSGVSLDQLPAQTPSLARGAEIYQANCASCHGTLGRGDGRPQRGLDPKPTNLAHGAGLKDQSPLDYYRRITIGVVGTAMPSFELAVAGSGPLGCGAVRYPPPAPQPLGRRPSCAQLVSGHRADVGHQSCWERSRRGTPHPWRWRRWPRYDAFSRMPQRTLPSRSLAQVRGQLESTYVLARKGDSSANTTAFDAYMTFEQVERGVRAKNPALAAELEGEFAALRARVASGGTATELDSIRRQLDARAGEGREIVGR